jgi:hypothetical protein
MEGNKTTAIVKTTSLKQLYSDPQTPTFGLAIEMLNVNLDQFIKDAFYQAAFTSYAFADHGERISSKAGALSLVKSGYFLGYAAGRKSVAGA